jgi:hypothetical protein
MVRSKDLYNLTIRSSAREPSSNCRSEQRMAKKDGNNLHRLADAYAEALDRCKQEEEIHRHLSANPLLVTRGISGQPISFEAVSKFPLGGMFVTDFVVLGCRSEGNPLHVSLIELESPSARAFTKKGTPSASLAQAIRQTNNWDSWLQEHLDEFCLTLPRRLKGDYGKRDLRVDLRTAFVDFRIVIGRKADMTDDNNLYRSTLFRQHSSRLEVLSYDRITFTIRHLAEVHSKLADPLWL